MTDGGYKEDEVLEMARRAYETGDAGFEVLPYKCALLVIDMQDEFIKPHWTPRWVPEVTRQVPGIRRLVEHCRKKGIPVIFTVYSGTHNYSIDPKASDLCQIAFRIQTSISPVFSWRGGSGMNLHRRKMK